MNAVRLATNVWSRWLDSVAGVIVRLGEGLARIRTVSFGEPVPGQIVQQPAYEPEPAGALADASSHVAVEQARPLKLDLVSPSIEVAKAINGARVELYLHADGFLCRPLNLPRQAVGFLANVVRVQLDRLTPWSPTEIAYGWSEPVYTDDRISLTIAATPLARVQPLIDRVMSLGAHSVTVFASAPNDRGGHDKPIKISEQQAAGAFALGRVRAATAKIFIALALLATASVVVRETAGATLEAQHDRISQDIARLRTGAETNAQRLLARRKNEAPPAVVVLEKLAAILPDHTYVTELRLDARKLRLVGVTQNAASLIALMERSGFFTGATFFAPTTRSSAGTTEQFHIETGVQFLEAARS
jgi:general secretion pathway protein L